MPPLSLPKAPVEHASSARAVPAAIPAVPSHEVRGLKGPPSTLNGYVSPLQSAGTQGCQGPNGVGLSAPKTAPPALPAPGVSGSGGSGAALSLPALPKLTPPPPRALLKPPVVDLMSNSGLDRWPDGLPDFFYGSFFDTPVIAL